MPTIHREGSLRFVIYTDDHPPPHVHVIAPDGRAKIDLDKPQALSVRDLRRRDGKLALRVVRERRPDFMRVWTKLHG